MIFLYFLIYQFDYDCFHLRIIKNFLNEQIPTDVRGHKYITSKILDIDYNEVNENQVNNFKLLFFKLLYGSETIEHDVFLNVNKFKNTDFVNYKTLLGRSEKPKDKNSFNYFIQKCEVDIITVALIDILKYMNDNKLKSKICLYQYDALFFDFHKDEIDHIDNIKTIMELDNQYKVNIKSSTNFIF